jgi:AmiR/NasT family two-component response regulator
MENTGIVLIEDEFIVASDIKERVEEMGYRVCSIFHSGEAALERIGDISPDLALIDIKLNGGMDGIDTALGIRALMYIPIIFLTAYATNEMVERAKRVEPLGYVVKPFKDVELKAVIEIALYRSLLEAGMRSRAAELDVLDRLLPICSSCKKIRDESGNWHQVEMFFADRLKIQFTHSLCPDCLEAYYR